MKTSKDPRHLKRRQAVQEIFAWQFSTEGVELGELAQQVIENLNDIDGKVAIAAPNRPIHQINRIDLAILRLALFELVQNNTPTKVVVDEAVELAKEFGSDTSPSFINGALGNIITVLEKN